ncbi:RNA polymerase sigma factor [Sinosporangium siamense]|uniref:DNA-directed RNA polymerase specialized sigma subunit, sigma24 family n=1 Tax=Sinosporangium siamense TaxID=1367973 RepID=A0A919RGW8_9ACTN|nr:hypothetical protein [Sinosporangium siamense]GII92570.1 hypothetical protein Ssi02_28010 [Sinosporangium siamense]
MAHPLTGRRPYGDLVAELYDRHGTGLFAYCLDQLGDPDTAASAFLGVLSTAPPVEPPRAALYAAARREIFRRDVVHAPSSADPLADPATALVRRTLAELRPHQREVLLLTIVCGLTTGELAWVLDVASDTADELTISACHSFTQSITYALASLRLSPRLPDRVSEIYGALSVASIRDVLACLHWTAPPWHLRAQLLHAVGAPEASTAHAAQAHPLYVKSLWPTTATWPLPLSDNDPATSTSLFPADFLLPTPFGRALRHDASTEPMPRFREEPAPGAYRPRRAAPDVSLPEESVSPPVEAALRPEEAGSLPGEPVPSPRAPGEAAPPPPVHRPLVLSAPVPADVLDPPGLAIPTGAIGAPDIPIRADVLDALAPGAEARDRHGPDEVPGSLFTPAPRQASTPPVYFLPPDERDARIPAEPVEDEKQAPAVPSSEETTAAAEPVAEPERLPELPAFEDEAWLPARTSRRRRDDKPVKAREHHFDWVWELVGFVICIAIALLVFFSVPMIVNP